MPFGLGFGLVMPEKDEPTLAASPRALFAAPASAAWALPPPLTAGGGAMSDGESGSPANGRSGADGPADGDVGADEGNPDAAGPDDGAGGLVAGLMIGLGRVTAASDRFTCSEPNACPPPPAAGTRAAEATAGSFPSGPSPAGEPPGPSPGPRDGVSTPFSTPSSSAPLFDTRLSPAG